MKSYLTPALLAVIAATLVWSTVRNELTFRQLETWTEDGGNAAEFESRVVEVSQIVEGEGLEPVVVDLKPGVWAVRVIAPNPADIGVSLSSANSSQSIAWHADVAVISVTDDLGSVELGIPPGPAWLNVDLDRSWGVHFARHQCPAVSNADGV